MAVKMPSMPKPPIMAKNKSAFFRGEHITSTPDGRIALNSITCSPIGPILKLFLPCTLAARQPPSVVSMVPETTGGHQPSGSTLCHSC